MGKLKELAMAGAACYGCGRPMEPTDDASIQQCESCNRIINPSYERPQRNPAEFRSSKVTSEHQACEKVLKK